MLFDLDSHESICVIDLDTIMPGLSLMISVTVSDQVPIRPTRMKESFQRSVLTSVFESYADGFLNETAKTLNDEEIANLAFGAKLMTFECGIRFLTDYLEGDVYFRTTYPDHNIVRARKQFKLVADMEAHMDEINAIVEGCRKKYI